MSTSNFQVGQIVKYSKPVNKLEEDARFIVLEIHPPHGNLKEKLHVEYICNMVFKPISVYFSEEFTNAE